MEMGKLGENLHRSSFTITSLERIRKVLNSGIFGNLYTKPNASLINFMEQSLWEDNNHSANEEIPTPLNGIRSFIIGYTRTSHWFLSYARWIQSTTHYTVSLRSILILFSHVRLSGTFSSGFPTNILMHFSCPIRATWHAPLIDHSNNTEYILKHTSYEVLHYAVFSNLPPLPTS
jgi:hypothetical protein